MHENAGYFNSIIKAVRQEEKRLMGIFEKADRIDVTQLDSSALVDWAKNLMDHASLYEAANVNGWFMAAGRIGGRYWPANWPYRMKILRCWPNR